jgi:hypothetical protein
MLTHRKIIWEWMALPKDKAQSEEYMQRIANAFFSSVTMFGVGFASFVLWAKA